MILRDRLGDNPSENESVSESRQNIPGRVEATWALREREYGLIDTSSSGWNSHKELNLGRNTFKYSLDSIPLLGEIVEMPMRIAQLGRLGGWWVIIWIPSEKAVLISIYNGYVLRFCFDGCYEFAVLKFTRCAKN